MHNNLFTIRLLIATIIIFSQVPVFASDGQLEINQACAVNTGCFSGDTLGFPVTITQPGSYLLTGNLDLSSETVNVSGIVVSVPAVTVDLGGFQIAGPTICEDIGSEITCSPSPSGSTGGISFSLQALAGVVKNGIVRNMPNYGIISPSSSLRIQNITALHNGYTGIHINQNSLLMDSFAVQNGHSGIRLSTGSKVNNVISIGNGHHGINGLGTDGVVTETSTRDNGMKGFSLGLHYKFGKNNASANNGQSNVCGGGICTDRRRIYLTKEKHQGATVLSACATGFRIASQTDFQSISSYDYDDLLGIKQAYSGSTIPSSTYFTSRFESAGWVQSGLNEHESISDCNNWTSTSTLYRAFLIRVLGVLPDDEPGIPPLPPRFVATHISCAADLSVWCIEGYDANNRL